MESTSIANNFSQIFWGLKDDWWKQLFDGKFHHLGPKVFNEGLHKGKKEPGYYEGGKKGSEFASEHLGEPVTVNFYKELHKNAWSHFEVINTGVFHSAQLCREYMECLYFTLPKTDRKKIFTNYSRNQRISDLNYLSGEEKEERLQNLNIKSEEGLSEKITRAEQEIKDLNEQILNKIEELNNYILKRSRSLGTSYAIASIERNYDQIYVYYKGNSLEMVVENLFKEFYENIKKADSEDAKIRCIADLFQMLEWLHPFQDGQGRTDLILLSKLLTEHGMNPAILEEPYVSTFSNLDDWTTYLKAGMEKWRAEKNKLST